MLEFVRVSLPCKRLAAHVCLGWEKEVTVGWVGGRKGREERESFIEQGMEGRREQGMEAGREQGTADRETEGQ